MSYVMHADMTAFDVWNNDVTQRIVGGNMRQFSSYASPILGSGGKVFCLIDSDYENIATPDELADILTRSEAEAQGLPAEPTSI